MWIADPGLALYKDTDSGFRGAGGLVTTSTIANCNNHGVFSVSELTRDYVEKDRSSLFSDSLVTAITCDTGRKTLPERENLLSEIVTTSGLSRSESGVSIYAARR